MMKLEKMDDFFAARIDGYDAHMKRDIEGASGFYAYTASLLPSGTGSRVLDLGCGTGLELEEYFTLNPGAAVTGIDLSEAMLNVLKAKFPEKDLTLVRASYFDVPLGNGQYDAAVSVESLHHFPAEMKASLYEKLYLALAEKGFFVLTDYFAESEEAEEEYFANFAALKKEQGLSDGVFYHYDTPLTVEHEMEILRHAGFRDVRIVKQWGESTYTVLAHKGEGSSLTGILEQTKKRYSLEDCTFTPVSCHEGGRNRIMIVRRKGEKYVLRISALGDRSGNDYLAETEFVRFLAENGAPVADVIPSVQGRLVECMETDGKAVYVSLFAYAKGMLIADNGYRYREGAPLSEYFFNTGKALGAIHRLSRTYTPVHSRPDYFDKYNMTYLDRLIPEKYGELKAAIARRLEAFRALPKDRSCYGLVHFDFSDGNYHIDMDTGAITVFDFDNCMNCWYMFDLANLWIHNEGWTRQETDPGRRFELMQQCFSLQLQGYKTETDLPDEMLEKLPLFIDMVLIENIVDELECCAREGEALDWEDIEDAAECLINDIPYAGIGKAT